MLKMKNRRTKSLLLTLVMMLALAVIGGACTAFGETNDNERSGPRQIINEPISPDQLPFEFDILPSRSVAGHVPVQIITSEPEYNFEVLHGATLLPLESVNGVFSLALEDEYFWGFSIEEEYDIIWYTGKICITDNGGNLSIDVYDATRRIAAAPNRGGGWTYEGECNYGTLNVFINNGEVWYYIQFEASGTAMFWLGDMNNGSCGLEVYHSGQLIASFDDHYIQGENYVQVEVEAYKMYSVKIYATSLEPDYVFAATVAPGVYGYFINYGTKKAVQPDDSNHMTNDMKLEQYTWKKGHQQK